MAVRGTAKADGTLAAREKAKLRKVLRRFDLVLFTACAIVGLDSVAAAAKSGAQAVTWLALSLVIFLIPYGMIVAELGTTFPVEGGPYEWVRMAFGRAAGAVTSILYWLSNPLWIGGTLSAATISAIDAFVVGRPLGTLAEIAVGLIFTWITVGVAIIAFHIGKWGPSIGTLVKAGVVLLFAVILIGHIVWHGRPAGASSVADLRPSLNGFLATVGILVFMWVGFELSSGAAEEMHNPQRDVPVMILRSGVVSALMYGAMIVGIVLVIPKTSLTSVGGFDDAFRAVAAPLHSRPLEMVFAVGVIVTLAGSGAAWLEGADRTQAIAALDGAAPAWMGRFTSFGTPISVNLSSGAVSSVMCVFVFVTTRGSLANFFSIMLALNVSTAALAYLLIFPSLIILRRRYPEVTRPYRLPGGPAAAWGAVILTELFVVVTMVTMLWPGAINAMFGRPYSVETSWGVSRTFFEEVTLGSFAMVVMLGLAFWAIGGRKRRSGLTGIMISAAEKD